MDDQSTAPEEYIVVINHEEQYSIWAKSRPLPNGWEGVGVSGTEAECLDYIEKVWTDMRPRSVREFLKGQERQI